MITVSRLNGTKFILNCELIRTVEATPDTVITIVGGEKFMVRESVDQVVQASIDFKQKTFFGGPERK